MKIIKILFLLSLCFILIACDESTPNVDVENHTHITDNAVQEKFIGATCSLEGSYDEVVYCKDCKEEISRTKKTLPVTDHEYQNRKCIFCKKFILSEGLVFKLKDDDTYEFTGIGSCEDTEIAIPSEYNGKPVTSIGSTVFSMRSEVTGVYIPESISYINEMAFRFGSISDIYISNLAAWCNTKVSGDSTAPLFGGISLYLNGELVTNLVIPEEITVINNVSFRGCDSITSVTIHDGVTSISDMAFDNCAALESVTIGNGVEYIGAMAFEDCSSIKSIVIPNSVTVIGNGAFRGCSKLESATIGSGVSSIGTSPFFGCTLLKNIEVDLSNSSYEAIDGSLYTKGGETIIQYAVGKTETSFTLPQSVTTIREFAFTYTSLESITLNNKLSTIEPYAFSTCTALTDIIIPDSVTYLGVCAFENCVSLKNITIGNGISEIMPSVFRGCGSIESIILTNATGWHVTNNYEDFINKSGGIALEVTDKTQNAMYFTDTYSHFWWYKS